MPSGCGQPDSRIAGITATDHRNNPEPVRAHDLRANRVARVLERTFCSVRVFPKWRGSAAMGVPKAGFQEHEGDAGLGVWIVALKGASEPCKQHKRDEPQDEKCCERGPPRSRTDPERCPDQRKRSHHRKIGRQHPESRHRRFQAERPFARGSQQATGRDNPIPGIAKHPTEKPAHAMPAPPSQTGLAQIAQSGASRQARSRAQIKRPFWTLPGECARSAVAAGVWRHDRHQDTLTSWIR